MPVTTASLPGTVVPKSARRSTKRVVPPAPVANGSAAVRMTLNDYRRLQSLIAARRKSADETAAVWPVEQKLARARILDATQLPPDVVSIYSCVRFENEASGHAFSYTLVFPGEANIGEGKLSVLSPLGCALLGQSVGDTVTYRAPGGLESVRITALPFQPESVGDY